MYIELLKLNTTTGVLCVWILKLIGALRLPSVTAGIVVEVPATIMGIAAVLIGSTLEPIVFNVGRISLCGTWDTTLDADSTLM